MRIALPRVAALAPALLLLAGAGGAAARAEEAAPADAAAIERQEWMGHVAAGGALRIKNIYGDVRIRHGGPAGGQVEALAIVQQGAKGAWRLMLVGFVNPDGVEIDVAQEPSDAALDEESQRRRRADLTVFVPEGVATRVKAFQGLVEVKGLRADLEVSTHGGEVRVTGVTGRIGVETDVAAVLATLDPFPKGPVRVESTVGDVTAYVPADADATATVATSGEIGTDWSINIEHVEGQEPDKLGRARLGRGGAEIRLASRQGRVRLLRLPRGVPASPVKPEN